VIDPRAIVAVGAQLAADVEIGPFSVIGPEVVIGSGTRVASHVVITGPTRIGAHNHIFQFASIGDAPQDKKYAGEPTRTEIGDRNVIREFCTVHRGTVLDQGLTRIGNDNMLLAYSHVAHDCVLADHIVLSNYVALAGHVHLDDWAILSGYSGVHQFCKIGAHAFIANNTAVTRDVPPYVMAVGLPAAPHSVNTEGLKRRGFSSVQIRNIREAYRVLYRMDLPLAQALKKLQERAAAQPELKVFIDFIASSSRSLIR
jgi:UDP-N-acetylglucosamine acyltransferase